VLLGAALVGSKPFTLVPEAYGRLCNPVLYCARWTIVRLMIGMEV
jgi:hypothetical protein